MANKYEEAYNKAFKGLKGKSEDITSRSRAYGAYAGEVSALPYQLKDEFRQRRDPAFDQRIRESEQKVLGGAIQGLNKYQDIQNPFQRRALAEQYQGDMSTSLQGLYDERERRQGTILDYIDKWTGLFGAEAKKEELILQSMKEGWQRESSMAGDRYGAMSTGLQEEESRDRWNQEFQLSKDQFAFTKSQAGRSGSSASSSKYQNRLEEVADDVYSGKYSREQAKTILQREFSDQDPNDIYKYVPNEFEKSPEFWGQQGQQKDNNNENQWQSEKIETEVTAKEIQKLRDKHNYSDNEILDKMRGTSYYPYAKKLLE